MAKHFYRPFRPEAAAKEDIERFPQVNALAIEAFGGWAAVQETHFADGGVFDQIMKAGRP